MKKAIAVLIYLYLILTVALKVCGIDISPNDTTPTGKRQNVIHYCILAGAVLLIAAVSLVYIRAYLR